MDQKYLDRIKEMSELEKTFDDCNDIYPPSQKSVESLKVVLEMLDDLDMIDRIDPDTDIYPDNCCGISIVYHFDDCNGYISEITVKDNFVILSSNLDGSYGYDCFNKVIPLSGKYFKAVKAAHNIAEYLSYTQSLANGVKIDCPLRDRWASIRIDIYDEGLRFVCDDIVYDVFIEAGDTNTLLEKLNFVCNICNPNARFELTEKGIELLKQIKVEENEGGK